MDYLERVRRGQEIAQRLNAEDEERKRQEIEKVKREMGDAYPEPEKKYCDSIYTLEDGVATVAYIASMVFGSIFIDRWIIWIAATIIYFGHITRHSRNK